MYLCPQHISTLLKLSTIYFIISKIQLVIYNISCKIRFLSGWCYNNSKSIIMNNTFYVVTSSNIYQIRVPVDVNHLPNTHQLNRQVIMLQEIMIIYTFMAKLMTRVINYTRQISFSLDHSVWQQFSIKNIPINQWFMIINQIQFINLIYKFNILQLLVFLSIRDIQLYRTSYMKLINYNSVYMLLLLQLNIQMQFSTDNIINLLNSLTKMALSELTYNVPNITKL
ncbi:hypothetical protein pb186bvf_020974 [Paramecium bursaria]